MDGWMDGRERAGRGLTYVEPVTSRRPEPAEAKLTPLWAPLRRPCLRVSRYKKGGGLFL